LHRRGERVGDRLLGDVDVTEDTDQDGHRATVLVAEHIFDLRDGEGRHVRYQSSASSWNGRTSIGSVVARVSRTTVAVLGGYSPPAKTHAPAAFELLVQGVEVP
jgi:hypothetical protein